jgi:hypothetical protein
MRDRIALILWGALFVGCSQPTGEGTATPGSTNVTSPQAVTAASPASYPTP